MRSSRSLVTVLVAGLVVMTPAGAMAAPAPATPATAAGAPVSAAPAGPPPPLAALVSVPSAPSEPLAPGDDGLSEVDLLDPSLEPEPEATADNEPKAPGGTEPKAPGGTEPEATEATEPEAPSTSDESGPDAEEAAPSMGARSITPEAASEAAPEVATPDAGEDAGEDAGQDDADGDILERSLTTEGATVVGLAWEPAGDARPTAQIRFGRDGTWEPWADVEMEPTAADGEGHALASEMSEGMVAAGADTVQVRLSGVEEAPLASASIVLVAGGADPAYPGFGMSRAMPASPEVPVDVSTDVSAAVLPMAASNGPAINTRRSWGANETIARAGCESPEYGSRLDRFVVHHTAGSNTYSAADVPGILRGIQNFHRSGRGWCDVGYNVLVDKYGGIWEGRRGGLNRLVVGVHASGHNTNTVGLSVLGNYVSVTPSSASINALARVIGWKSYLHGLDPVGRSVKNGTSYKHVIGHRDVAATACPGRIQSQLDAIARSARTQALGYTPAFENVRPEPGTTGGTAAAVRVVVPVPATWQVSFRDGNGRTVATTSGTATSRGTVLARMRPSQPLAAGAYRAHLSGRSTLGKTFTTTAVVHLSGETAHPYRQIVASPDFSGDGIGDLFAVDADGRLVLHHGVGNGQLTPARMYGPGWKGLRVYAPGDWDGDGQADIVSVSPSGRLHLYSGRANGNFRSPVRIGHGWTNYRIIPAGDVDGDGTADLLAIDARARLWLYPGDGRGGFRSRTQVGQGWNGFQLYAAGDMNGDGRVDIVSIDTAGRLFFYAGKGRGHFQAAVQVGRGWNGYAMASGADFNGDGINDLMGRDSQNRLWFYAGRSNGTYAAKVRVPGTW